MRHYSSTEYVEIFRDTLQKSEGFSGEGKDEAVYYDVNVMDRLAENHETKSNAGHETIITVSGDDTFQAARKLKATNPADDVLILNFANSVSRGGGVKIGALAQEEDLCRTSTLFLSLASAGATPFYHYNREHGLNITGSDTAIYSPKVYIIKDNDYQDITPVEVSAITMAAPVNRYGVDSVSIMEQRIYKMLCLAEETGKKRLVLGAWGCGAFGNDPLTIAEMFKMNLELFSCFDEVVFAVLKSQKRDSYNYKCFEEVFGGDVRKINVL